MYFFVYKCCGRKGRQQSLYLHNWLKAVYSKHLQEIMKGIIVNIITILFFVVSSCYLEKDQLF